MQECDEKNGKVDTLSKMNKLRKTKENTSFRVKMLTVQKRSASSLVSIFRKRASDAQLIAKLLRFKSENIAEAQIRQVLAKLKVPVLIVLVIINCFSGLYLFLWSVLLLKIPTMSISNNLAPQRIISAIMYLALSLLHIHEFVGLCCHWRAPSSPTSKSTKTTSRLSSLSLKKIPFISYPSHFLSRVRNQKWIILKLAPKFRKAYIKWPQKYEILHISRHLLVTLTISIHAHHMSVVIPEPAITFAYTFFVVLNCLFTPILFTSKNAFVKKYLTILLDSIFHFILSVGFPFVVFWPSYIQFMQTPEGFTNTNYASIAQHMLIDQLQTLNSFLDFFIAIIMHFSNHLSVHYLAKMALTTKRNQKSKISITSLSMKSKKIQPSSIQTKSRILSNERTPVVSINQVENPIHDLIPIKNRFQNFQRGLFIFASYSWAIALLIGSSSAFFHSPCPNGCNHRVFEWFSTSCLCRDFTYTCNESNPTNLNQTISTLESIDTGLLLLEIKFCKLTNGLPHGLLSRFQNLYILRLDHNGIKNWDASDKNLSSNLQYLDIIGSLFEEIPKKFENLPIYCTQVRISSTPLKYIPNKWINVNKLIIENGEIKSINNLFNLIHLEYLILYNNSILNYPNKIPNNLKYMDLRYNLIKYLPNNIHLNYLDISFNPIETIQSIYYLNIIKYIFKVDGTIFCYLLQQLLIDDFEMEKSLNERNNIIQNICTTKCTTNCDINLIGNNICDLSCMISPCEFDRMDCKI